MRLRLVFAILALAATAGAVWYFGTESLTRQADRMARLASTPPPARESQAPVTLAPEDLSAFATWLKTIPLGQRGQFVRGRITSLSASDPADRAKIRSFLLSGADADIERPSSALPLPFDAGVTTLRRYFLGLLEDFPAGEAVSLARTVLAATSDFREAFLALRALEHHQPDANRPETLAAVQRLLPHAAKPATSGSETTRTLAQFDRFAEPIAHYRLAEAHPMAMRAVTANPILAGRYTQAVQSFPTATRAAAWQEMFAQPAVAEELVNGTGTRSVDVWLDAHFRQQVANFAATQMNEPQRKNLIASLAEETGLHYSPKPLAEPKEPLLQPTDPAADAARAKARLAMVETLAPQAKTPALQSAVAETRTAIQTEIKATEEQVRLKPVTLPTLDPLGQPAGVVESQAQPAPSTPEPATPQ